MFGFFGRNTDASPPPTFKVFCKADEGRCLAIRDGALLLAAADPDDENQHWTKDVRYSRSIKDEEGNPVFSLVNMATGLAIQHPLGPGHPVRLGRFHPDDYSESVLWTESADLRKAFGCIRMMHRVDLCLDAPHQGVPVVTSYASRSESQNWKIVPWSGDVGVDELDSLPTSRIYCKADDGLSVTVRNSTLCLAPTDSSDEYQHWIEDKRPGHVIKDNEGCPAFALVNKVTGEAISGQADGGWHLDLKPYNPNYLDVSVLWATGPRLGHGFQCIHMANNISLNFNCFRGRVAHWFSRKRNFDDLCWDEEDGLQWKMDPWRGQYGTNIMLSDWSEEDNLQWKIVPWYASFC